MIKTIELAALAAFLALGPASFATAQVHRLPRPRQSCFRRHQAFERTTPPLVRKIQPQAAHEVPDWTVQYGHVFNPRGASGSFGAMLEGRNPAANAF